MHHCTKGCLTLSCCCKGHGGSFVAVDLGREGCQPWPASLTVTDPVATVFGLNFGIPTDFTADASGTALQPPTDSSAWEKLISVQKFNPDFQFLGCQHQRCGTLSHTFRIQPASASMGAPEAVNSSDAQRTFSVPNDISSDKFLPLDTDIWFKQNSRQCCLEISAVVLADNGTQSLPQWLSIWYKLSRSASSAQLTADHALRVSAQPGRGALGRHTVRILAIDQSLPNALPASVDLELVVTGGAPTIVGAFPAVEVADGHPLNFTLPSNVIQLNKPYGQLSYSAEQQGGMPLPEWMSVDEKGLLRGTPDLGTDMGFNLSITATDRDGAQATTSLKLYVRHECPVGLYRHFRLRLLPENRQTGWDNFFGYTVCTLAWETDEPKMNSFPDPAGDAWWNVSGTTPHYPYYDSPAPITAFHQLKDAGCDEGNAWWVS